MNCAGIKILDLARDLRVECGSVKVGDRPMPFLPAHRFWPKNLMADAQRRDDSQAGDHYPIQQSFASFASRTIS